VNKKKIIAVVLLTLSVFTVCLNLSKKSGSGLNGMTSKIIDRMPLVQDDPFAAFASQMEPKAERGPEVQTWIEAGVRIHVTGALGSGTIVYYDENEKTAYVQSCGHLWDGNMTAEEGKRKNLTCKVMLFYKNGQRLSTPAEYPANVLFYSNNKNSNGHLCQDVSLLTFKPDFIPPFFPVAPDDTVVHQDQRLHSIGCDHGTEVAHYSVRALGERGDQQGQWPDLVTTENSPRPGRSGGGLISDERTYVGICWGTSSYDGGGNGYFTPLKTVRYFNEKNGYGWINNVGSGSLAQKLPIVDRNNKQQKYPPNYIPLPHNR